jgi:hypothetical protein
MKETYIGPAGTFLKDGPYDLPESTIKRLPKGSYKKTCAPWDRLKTKKKVAKKEGNEEKGACGGTEINGTENAPETNRQTDHDTERQTASAR